jgi:hypothetical protein
MTFATTQELYLIEDLSTYSDLPSVDIELQRAESKILRLLNQDWYSNYVRNHADKQHGALDTSLLDVDEWRNPVIYYALAYLLLPKLEQTTPIKRKIYTYHLLWEETYNRLLTFGITYDADDTLPTTVVTPPGDFLRLRA